VEAKELLRFLFTDDLPLDASMLLPKKKDAGAAALALAKSAAALRDVTPWATAGIEVALRKLAEELGWHIRELSHVVRAATMGGPVGLPLFESLELLGRERALARIARALEVLGEGPRNG
jgi:glutamyl-tRNA synthetase